MPATENIDEFTQFQTDEYSEQLASQEQTYLDEVEARLIEGLTSTEASS
ncbi:hypothetical protein [Paludibaculum fermentans]|uniref:Uncharacterized protein n=1 Tax=Paludibaculum fermentans TaxID=1473598 RepID=A0A7S7SJX5_PALFE|nr:hypothetical protein [Paludibaculum fermentans]QOY86410.1 hypothetical protein IRI77_26910 [Paludibaculum fermentans]